MSWQTLTRTLAMLFVLLELCTWTHFLASDMSVRSVDELSLHALTQT